MKLKNAVIPLLFGVLSSNAMAMSFSVVKKDINYSWSIDNSKFGGLKKTSEITWKASPLVLELSNDFSFGTVGVYFGGASSVFNDKDWCRSSNGVSCSGSSKGKIINFSNDTSVEGSLKTAGLFISGELFSFKDILGLDNISISNKTTLEMNQYTAKGLVNDLSNKEKYNKDVTANKTETYFLSSVYYLNFIENYGKFSFKLSPLLGFSDIYMIDHHVLRKDVQHLKFKIMDAGFVYGGSAEVDYKVSPKLSIVLAGEYKKYSGIVAKAVTMSGSDKEDIGVGLGSNQSIETKLTLTAKYDF
ncbi:hypothetical protein [Photobacterium kishitanii]|uniref:Protochlamydia outer membrane protein domain-containing protein n=1 Tax=Photobacterium kishitanii TaxID=318456 RepID=A0A2T3KLZ4_9GAMM|nr:hypothetical protein [Photobacterium kishitanii]PSV00711.1 hypothetical protein C9J27_06100 [Photobacterium kishitanii]